MENPYPLVSIIIPTYKRPTTLDRAIDSVLNQTYPNVEIVVVDDNNPNTEGRKLTEDKMAPYARNERVIYIKHEHNKNGSAARNTGARASKGEYIGFLDDDDVFLPRKIESQVDKLNSLSDDWGCCYNNYYTQKAGEKSVRVMEHREGDLYLEALKNNICVNAGSNLLIRRKYFDMINGFDESFKRSQDHEFLVRLLKVCKIAYVEESGLVYSIGTTNVTYDYDAVMAHYLNAFKNDIEALPDKDKKKVYENIHRLRFFHRLRSQHDFKGAMSIIRDGDLSAISAASYTFNQAMDFVRRWVENRFKKDKNSN